MDMWQGLFALIDDALDTYIVNTAGDVIAYVTPLFTSMMILWIAIWGYLMMFGKASEPLQEGLFRIIRVGFILTLGLTVGTYMGIVVDVLASGPEQLAAVVTGAPPGSTASILDTLFTRIFQVADKAWDKAGVMNGNFGLYLIAGVIMVFGILVTIVIAFLILVGKLGTTILLGVGPLFIISLLFNSTQRFFESWLGMVVNFGLILVLGSSIGRVILEISDVFLTKMEAGDTSNMWAASIIAAFFALCFLFLKQVPSMAAALGGGVALATQGALSSAINSMRPTTIRRQYRNIRRDASLAGHAATSPYRGAKAGYAAYQKRFGAGNTITGA